MVQDSNSPSVTVMASFKVGARHEKEGQFGIAHLIEHNMFKGTKRRPSSKILSYEVENLGAYQNAFTSHEQTSYYIKGPKGKALNMIDLLADMILNPLIPEDELIKEKKVIIEEIKMYSDIPRHKIAENFLKTLYQDHPLGRDIAGYPKQIEGISRKECFDFINNYYGSKNLYLVISGCFDEKAVMSSLEASFEKITKGSMPELDKFIPQESLKGQTRNTKDIEQSHIMIGGFCPSYKVPKKERIPLYLGRVIMGGGMGSKLSQRIREELGLAYYVHMDLQEFEETGYYTVALGVDHDNVTKAVPEVITQLQTLKNGAISPAEFERARNYLIGSFITFFETSDDLAQWYGGQLINGEELWSAEEMIKSFEKTRLGDVVAAWEKLLKNDNLTVVTLGRDDQKLEIVNI